MTQDNICIWCDEPVAPGEHRDFYGVLDGRTVKQVASHWECGARSIIGSVGHQQGLCSCDGGPGTLDDPPGMTKRQAAQAAFAYFKGKRDILTGG